MRFLIITDLEGVAGIDSFSQTRTEDMEIKAPGMRQLAREANACAQGIKAAAPGSVVDIWDGHGSGGMFAEDVTQGNYIQPKIKPYKDMSGYDGLLFVGQHAMAGTYNAPLCHTYSSLRVAHYKVNGVFMGEFSCRALIAGLQGVPTIFLAGDDKAGLEAAMFVPGIETVAVKQGLGWEAAVHMDKDEACAAVFAGAARAVRKMGSIAPLVDIKPPFTLEMRNYNPIAEKQLRPGCKLIDTYTYQWFADDLCEFPL